MVDQDCSVDGARRAARRVAVFFVPREGDAATFAPGAGEVLGIFDAFADITDDGRYVFGTNTTGGTAEDEYIVLFDGTQWTTVAREEGAAPNGLRWGC